MTGPARHWYGQLGRSTRQNWKRLLECFMVQFGGFGVSVGRQYYHAKKRSDETPLEYLFRLNLAAIRAKILFREGPSATRREHVKHFIETLDDRDLAKQLALLRLEDADMIEETLRAYQRTEHRQTKVLVGSNKFRPRSDPTADRTSSKPARAMKPIRPIDSGSSDSESSGSESNDEQRRVYMAKTPDRGRNKEDRDRKITADHMVDRGNGSDQADQPKACSHCGSTKHDDRGCWKRLTCQKCGRKGHPSDKCFYVCGACREVHDVGNCPMEEFYNLIRKWYVPTKHAGMFPTKVEEMLN